MTTIDMVSLLIAENIILYLIAREITFKLDKKREREVCKFYIETEIPFIISLAKKHNGLKFENGRLTRNHKKTQNTTP